VGGPPSQERTEKKKPALHSNDDSICDFYKEEGGGIMLKTDNRRAQQGGSANRPWERTGERSGSGKKRVRVPGVREERETRDGASRIRGVLMRKNGGGGGRSRNLAKKEERGPTLKGLTNDFRSVVTGGEFKDRRGGRMGYQITRKKGFLTDKWGRDREGE